MPKYMSQAQNRINKLAMNGYKLAKLIKTDSGHLFVYDGATARIISVDSKETFREKDFKELETKILAELYHRKILVGTSLKSVIQSSSFENCEAILQNKIPSLVLQTTRNCNFACRYCVYSGNYFHMRPLAPENMPLEIMKRSIDFYAAYNKNLSRASVSFFGGEPLLRFQTILAAIDYAKTIFKDKSVKFSISTNGLLLNSEVYHHLGENPNVRLAVTVNGYLHDKYRKDFLGKGTLERILANLKILRMDFPQVWKNQLSFIANYSSVAEVLELFKFYGEVLEFDKQPLFLSKIRRDLGNEIIENILHTEAKKEQEAKKLLRQKYYSNREGFLNKFYKDDLDFIDEREIFAPDAPMKIASCTPFSVKLFVRTDGAFNLCERTSDSFILGNLDSGFDDEKILLTIKDVEQLINKNCNACWAQRICRLCFQNMVDADGKIRKKIPARLCEDIRRNLYELLQIYCEIYG